MPVAKCPLSRPLPPFRDFQRLHCGGIFESPVAVFNSLFIKDIQAELRKMPAIISLWKVENTFFEILCALGGGRADGLPWRG